MNVQAALNRHAQAAEATDQKIGQVLAANEALIKRVDVLTEVISQQTIRIDAQTIKIGELTTQVEALKADRAEEPAPAKKGK